MTTIMPNAAMDESAMRLIAAALDVVTSISDDTLRRRCRPPTVLISVSHLAELHAAIEDIMPGITAMTRDELQRRR